MDGPNTMEVNGAAPNAVPEAPQVRVPDLERIRNAHKKRMMQIKEWQQYDRKMNRESEKLQRKGLSPVGDKGLYRSGPQVKFPQSLIFLEAAARGDLDEVQSLLRSGVCPDVANEDGLTALHQQMYRFSAEEAAELRRLAAEDPQGCCIDNTPEMCRLLLRFGANPNARDTERWTPLHAAATCHHTDLCAILIAHGADLLAMNADGNMPYECCMPGPTLSLIESEMDKRGITQEELDDLHRLPECQMLTDMETLYKNGADFNVLDKQGASMLHIAAACGYEEVTIFLLKHGAKIDLLDRDGWQAIHIAACWEHMEIIEILVNFGADIMAQTTSGETVFNICDDLEMHARLMEIKEECERKQFQQQDAQNRPEKPRELIRRRSSTNPRSASIRRTSMREKKMISWKEAKQEAEMRGVGGLNLGDGDPEPTATTPGSASRNEISRVSSPLTVNTSSTPVQQPPVRGSSSTVLPVSPTEPRKQPSNTVSPSIVSSNVQSIDVMPSPKPKRTSPSSSNGITSHKGNDAATVGGATRLPSKSSERNNSTDLPPPRTPISMEGSVRRSKRISSSKEKPEAVVEPPSGPSQLHKTEESNPQGLFDRLEKKRQSSRRKAHKNRQSTGGEESHRDVKKDEHLSRRSSKTIVTTDNRRHSQQTGIRKSYDSEAISKGARLTEVDPVGATALRRTRSLPNRTKHRKSNTHSRTVQQEPDPSVRPQPVARTRRSHLSTGESMLSTSITDPGTADSALHDSMFSSATGVTNRQSVFSTYSARVRPQSSNPTRTLSGRTSRRVEYIETPANDRKQSKWCCCS